MCVCVVYRMEPRATSAQRLKQDLFSSPFLDPSIPTSLLPLGLDVRGSFDSLPSDAKKAFLLAKNQREKVTSRKNISTPPSPLPRPASIYSLSSSHSIKSSFYFVLFPNLVFFHIIISFRFHSFSSSSPPSSD